MGKLGKGFRLRLLPGETVEVKSGEEIAATLDGKGTLEGLLFAPEMRKYCGKKFKVLKRVNKLILEGEGVLRSINDVVILDGVFCSGKYHGGCQKSCPLLWKEAWLKRVKPPNK